MACHITLPDSWADILAAHGYYGPCVVCASAFPNHQLSQLTTIHLVCLNLWAAPNTPRQDMYFQAVLQPVPIVPKVSGNDEEMADPGTMAVLDTAADNDTTMGN